MLGPGALSEGAFRPQECPFERLLLRQAGRHDFAEQARDFLVAQRTLIAFERHPQDIGFAFRAIEIHRLAGCRFGDADQLRETRAFIEQRMDPRIDGVDAVADISESTTGRLYPGSTLPRACRARPGVARPILAQPPLLARWCSTACQARTPPLLTL